MTKGVVRVRRVSIGNTAYGPLPSPVMGKTVVVTGAARGLGRAVVDEFLTAGWTVVAVGRSAEPAALAGNRAALRWVTGDVRQDLSEPLRQATGGQAIDVVVNNAGIGAPPARLADVEPTGVIDAFDVNVMGPLRIVQALLPELLAAPRPLVLNVSSRLGSVSAQARADFADLDVSYAYRLSKAAQNMLTIAMAHELRGQVRCWAVHPGTLATTLGQPNAATSPAEAARALRDLAESSSTISARFCSLGAADLDW